MTSRSVRVAAAAIALLALAGCTSGGSASSSVAASWPATVDALPTMDPTAFHDLIAAQKGHPVLVNIWASWCDPCIAEAPDLIAAHQKYGDTVRFIGVDAQDDRSGATTFIDEHKVPYPSVFDPSNAIAVSYGLFSPPDTLFFDTNGNLVKTIPGQISSEDLDTNLQAIAG
ncbi:MAG TPA: TlpA disulfide reductase family protein [Actinomycetota bacterium]|jgi:thiol-disulfide isomerase/thioredoxin|nr:TlpA disulfide reductase family protein [Actinomycetota bacterium]